ncbi:MAG: ChaN family lipoprotein [Gammaproteobacteria bacterium]|nr:ChaN family lipoprotein [Gammaproteobacteria bacterium]
MSILLLGGCIEKMKPENSERPMQNDHPMVDKIWDVKQASYISQQQLLARLLKAKYLLLGETHDNISHHEYQAKVISTLAKAKVAASVHFEMIDDRQYVRLGLMDTTSLPELMDKLTETESGWNYEKMYRVVFEQVLQAGYNYRAANLSYEKIRKIIKQGEKKIPDNIKELLADVALSGDQLHELEQEVIKGHCNALPAKMVSPMILAQRVRDAKMSLSMLQSEDDYRILIAGSGHARTDRGVPMYLTAKDPQAAIISVGFLEVMADKNTVNEYTESWEQQYLPFNYVWFTPRFDRKDPCEQFVKMLKK